MSDTHDTENQDKHVVYAYMVILSDVMLYTKAPSVAKKRIVTVVPTPFLLS